ncbi:uncharacterized protein B0I36DRAFT_379458 [Microdochium trichocladiopsis]|uniref:Uncharacterized protein n=1 Tax=Microdochium trichocladiopsis TaxID=1682393 RepID=A0A9P9BW67_9PEZI|nr:uncharacterized protein B0I36DRAFT_379458 [Microdochium trichocladiopsis]KAH7040497.1 hypothetical protein B0I36DRAFT_379458 [Microdochium trichocladiopsis]
MSTTTISTTVARAQQGDDEQMSSNTPFNTHTCPPAYSRGLTREDDNDNSSLRAPAHAQHELPAYTEVLHTCPTPTRTDTKPAGHADDEKATLAAYYSDDKHPGKTESRPSTSSARSALSYASSSSTTAKSNKSSVFLHNFVPTVQLQIQHGGKPWLSLPFSPRPDPIPIFPVVPFAKDVAAGYDDDDDETALGVRPVYVSVRPERNSGSSILMTGEQFASYSQAVANGQLPAANNSSSSSRNPPQELASTTYRFGPNHPPMVALLVRDKAKGGWQRPQFPVQSKGVVTRAVEFSVPKMCFPSTVSLSLPATKVIDHKFTWRYASSRERAAVGRFIAAGTARTIGHSAECGKGKDKDTSVPNSVLVLERAISTTTTTTTTTGQSEKAQPQDGDHAKRSKSPRLTTKNTHKQVVALLVRSEELRSPGSSASSAGNGGRLFIDLRSFEGCGDNDGGQAGHAFDASNTVSIEESQGDMDSRGDKELGQRMVVTTALVMLKREVDRRRAMQIGALAVGIGGV